MSLPYENATSGKNAVAEMQRVLRAFGASSFGVMDNFAAGEIIEPDEMPADPFWCECELTWTDDVLYCNRCKAL